MGTKGREITSGISTHLERRHRKVISSSMYAGCVIGRPVFCREQRDGTGMETLSGISKISFILLLSFEV